MMKRIMAFLIKHSGVLAALALFVSVSSVDSACYLAFHQPKMPEELDVYRR